MCDVPARRPIREALQPSRVVLAIAAVATITAGLVVQGIPGLIILALGAVVMLLAFLFPVVREVEFGFPAGVRISAGLQDRQKELHDAFEGQRGDLGLYTKLLCDDPVVATELLEAAWARTAATWRGPVTPELRSYVLCVFVHLLATHQRWSGAPPKPSVASASGSPAMRLLAGLPEPERTVVVLREFAELPLAQIAAITERPLPEVTRDLQSAQQVLARASIDGGAR